MNWGKYLEEVSYGADLAGDESAYPNELFLSILKEPGNMRFLLQSTQENAAGSKILLWRWTTGQNESDMGLQ